MNPTRVPFVLLALVSACTLREPLPVATGAAERSAIDAEGDVLLTSGQNTMVEALAAVRAGRSAETRIMWQLALSEYPTLRDYHLYYLALANASAGDLGAARRNLETLLHEEGDSVLVPLATLHLGRLSVAEPSVARKHLRAARAALPRGGQEWAKSCLLLAELELERGRSEAAHALLNDIRKRVGPGVARRRAGRGIHRIVAANPKLAPQRPLRAAEEARLLLREGAAAEAERLLVTVLESMSGSRLRPRLLTLLATAQREQGFLEAAEETLHTLLADYPKHSLAPKALLSLAKWRWSRDDDAVAEERFNAFLRRYPTHPMVPDSLYAIGRIHQDAGRFSAARTVYRRVAKRVPRGPLAAEARWRQGWLYYVRGEYAKAAVALGQLAGFAKRDSVLESALYWEARSVEHDRGLAEARASYVGVVRDFPHGYYALWAERRLGQRGPMPETLSVLPVHEEGESGDAGSPVAARHGSRNFDSPAGWLDGSTGLGLTELEANLDASVLDHVRFGRASELATMGLWHHAARELDAIRFPPTSQLDSQLLLLEAYARIGRPERAISIPSLRHPRRTDAIGHPFDPYVYPLGYWKLVQRYAGASSIDPYLVLALIRQESRFDSAAVSPVRARGLMQLMPATAVRVARSVAVPVPREQDLSRPRINIELGSAYLRELLDRYDGAVHKALAAYNAGESAVAKWERRFLDAAPDEFVEQISYPETRNFVKAVMRNYRVYRLLYDAGPSASGDPGWGNGQTG